MPTVVNVDINALFSKLEDLTKRNKRLETLVLLGGAYVVMKVTECNKLKKEVAELKKVEGE